MTYLDIILSGLMLSHILGKNVHLYIYILKKEIHSAVLDFLRNKNLVQVQGNIET